jgi:DNA-directed RNA polymerase II subunit RPB2
MFHDDLIDEAEHGGVGEETDDEITQEDAWAVISAFFEEKGLVRQQLDSFDEFVSNTMQEIIDEAPEIVVRPESQHMPGAAELDDREYKISFGQIYLSKPLVTESDNDTNSLFPKEARLRNLTCVGGWQRPHGARGSACRRSRGRSGPAWSGAVAGGSRSSRPLAPSIRPRSYSAPMYVDLVRTEITKKPDGESEESTERYEKVFLAKVPIMLRSKFCSLNDHTDKELTELGEDPYDQVRGQGCMGSERMQPWQRRLGPSDAWSRHRMHACIHAWVGCRREVTL